MVCRSDWVCDLLASIKVRYHSLGPLISNAHIESELQIQSPFLSLTFPRRERVKIRDTEHTGYSPCMYRNPNEAHEEK